jgi:hypothetical protein
MDRIKSNVSLYFLGKRGYVQAPIQLEFALKGIQNEQGIEGLSDILVRRYKQLQQVDSPLEILSAGQVEPEKLLRATLAISIGERSADYSLIAVPGEIERRPDISYRQVDYRKRSDIEASAILLEAKDFWEVLTECIQLTKVFHIEKYDRDVDYRFVVGGFEQLKCAEPTKGESVEIGCRIMHHFFHEGTIYNYTRISVRGESHSYSFGMPFIGRELGK